MTNNGMLIVISGPSGVGKDTLAKEFVKNRADCEVSISATTRAPRTGEKEGVDYYYTTVDIFESHIANEELLEYAKYNSNYYGTLKNVVGHVRSSGKHVILIIETQGAKKIRQLCPDALLIFIMPPNLQALKARLCGRNTEDENAVLERLKIACEEIEERKNYDYIVVNDDLGCTVKQLEYIVNAAQCSPKHMPCLLERVCEE